MHVKICTYGTHYFRGYFPFSANISPYLPRAYETNYKFNAFVMHNNKQIIT